MKEVLDLMMTITLIYSEHRAVLVIEKHGLFLFGLKEQLLTQIKEFFTAYDGSNINAECNIQFQSDGKIQINNNNTSSNTDTNLKTDRVFRDPSSWYHIVIGTDMTQGTASDRVNL